MRFFHWQDLSAGLRCVSTLVLLLCSAASARAAHPLITDDTGTQGSGGRQIEFQGDWLRTGRVAAPAGVPVEQQRKVNILTAVFSYGIIETLDVQFGLSRLDQHTTENGIVTSDASGMADSTLEFKWRFHEADGFSIALKPGMTLPTGDEEKGLGTGRASWGMTLIVTRETGPWSFLGNIAYSRARFGLPQQAAESNSDLWRVSGGATYALTDRARLVGELGVRSNESRNDPFPVDGNSQFGMVGMIYSLSKKIDLDAGYRRRLNRAEFDRALLAGATFRW
jgi:hypothetical protein